MDASTQARAPGEESFEGHGGVRLFARSWRPDEPRAKLVVVHGLKSHSGLYTDMAEQLVARGFAVHAADLRGHGKSDGERQWVEKFEDYVDDLDRFMALVRAREPGLPTFLLGHSAGGVVAVLHALENQSDFAGLICESFAFELPAPDVALALLKGLSHIAPHAHVLNLKEADFSRDPVFVELMKSDPLIAHEAGTTQLLAALIHADERLARSFRRMTLPLLILHGTADRATKAHGSKRFFDEAPAKDKTLKLYEGHYHDLLHDVGREQVLSDIVEWMSTRIART